MDKLRNKSTCSPIKTNAQQHKINTKKLQPGLVASYDIRPGNGEGLFWFRYFINLSLTYLLRHLPTYLQPRTHTWQETACIWTDNQTHNDTEITVWVPAVNQLCKPVCNCQSCCRLLQIHADTHTPCMSTFTVIDNDIGRIATLSLRNKELRERLGIDDIILILQQNRLRWYGHVLRKKTLIG